MNGAFRPYLSLRGSSAEYRRMHTSTLWPASPYIGPEAWDACV